MPRYVAFLRAVNVGGRVVKMAQLKTIFESVALGGVALDNVETFIASGNVIFSHRTTKTQALGTKIQKTLEDELNILVPLILRTDVDVCSIAARKYAVFSTPEVDGAHSLNIGVLQESLSPSAANAMLTFNTENEEFRTDGREVYMLLHTPVTNSKFTLAKFEKAIGVSTTFRKITTFERLAAKYPAQ